VKKNLKQIPWGMSKRTKKEKVFQEECFVNMENNVAKGPSLAINKDVFRILSCHLKFKVSIKRKSVWDDMEMRREILAAFYHSFQKITAQSWKKQGMEFFLWSESASASRVF